MEVVLAATFTTHTAPTSTLPFLHRHTTAHRSSPTHIVSFSRFFLLSLLSAGIQPVCWCVPQTILCNYYPYYHHLLRGPELFTRGTYTTKLSHSPTSTPDHSHPHQRLHRSSDTYSEVDLEEDPEEEPEDQDQAEPTQGEALPVEHATECACTNRDWVLQARLDQEIMPKDGKGIMEEVQGT